MNNNIVSEHIKKIFSMQIILKKFDIPALNRSRPFLNAMTRQEEGNAPTSSEVRQIVSDEVRPLLEKMTDLVDKLERYHQHDIQFQQNLILLVSQMFKNQEISMEGFDKIDSFLRKEFFWGR